MRADVDIAIIGSGMVGVAAALNALTRSFTVALIDDSAPEEAASFGNAGLIAAGGILPLASPALRRRALSLALNRDPGFRLDWGAGPHLRPWLAAFWARCRRRAAEEAAAALNPLCASAFDEHTRMARLLRLAPLIERKGFLKLYRTARGFAAAGHDHAILTRHRIAMQLMTGEELAALEPALRRRFARAVLFPQSGLITDPAALVAGWRDGVRLRGGRLVTAKVSALIPREDGVSLALSTGETLHAAHAVVAAGFASAALLRPLGFDLPLVAERGYHRNFARPAGRWSLERPFHDVEGFHSLSPLAQGYRIATFSEFSHPDRPPHVAQINRAVAEVRETLPLGKPLGASAWMGSRPSTPDSLPIIGALPGLPRLLCAFGHGDLGMTLGPATGLMVCELLSGLAPSLDPAPFAPQRFLR